MHSALRPYMTTGLAIVGTSVIALSPITPPAPAYGAATTAKQVTQQVTLSARVITINPSPDALEMGEQLQGTICDGNGTPCYELEYTPVWTTPGQFGYGVEALRELLAGNLGEETTIFGFSEGAVVASQWLEKHLEDPEAYPAPNNLTFVVIGNPSRKYGGSAVPWGQTWPDSPYKVIDVAQQYDPTVDMPTNPFNVLANINAAMGFFTNHLGNGYSDVDLDDPANSKWTEGNIEYVFVPAKTLPILSPLYALGLDELADELTGPLQYLIEQGYDRDDRITTTPIADPDDKSIFYAPINLIETIANIPYYAVAGTNRFANAMRASGSWWVYTPVNVLGWDPANPEMTRAFVDFLIAIPSISGPMGEIADYWARANLPMNAGCTGFPPCEDPSAITDQMFKVMLWDLFSPNGFTFTDPITPQYNPISDTEAFWGQELGLTGDPVEWYGETIHLEPFAETTSFWDHLISAPEGIKTPTLEDQIEAFMNLADGLMTTWNPFVPKSYVWNPDMTPFAYLARPFAKLLCPTCNKVDPFMPEDWKVGLDVYPGAYIPPSVKDQYDPETGKYIGDPVEGLTAEEIAEWNEKAGLNDIPETEEAEEDSSALSTLVADETTEEAAEEEKPDVISAAVQGLLDKFDKAPAEETPAEETPVEETPVEETPVEETPVEETPVEETPVEETPVEETPVEETPVEETPVEETPVEETPAEETPAEDEEETPAADEDETEAEKEATTKASKAEEKAAEKAEATSDSEADSSAGSSGSGGSGGSGGADA